ncbi:MAG: serine/threonine-protein kinase [Myxococcota bacterium]
MDHGTPEPMTAPTTNGTGLTDDSDPSTALSDSFAVDRTPETIDRYTVLERIGRGGMGVVYEAHDPRLDRRVALKLIRADGRRDRLRARLLCEAKALARISHPNVLPVYDSGIVADQAFVAMALVRGRTLRRWIEDERPSWARIVEILVALGRGLTVVHEAGLVHRDIKPENILLDQSDRPLLIDFGLARVLDEAQLDSLGHSVPIEVGSDRGRLTQQGARVGSPAYMAPEQRDGQEVSPASDQFAYCVTAWEALFGRRPFEVDHIEHRAISIETGPAPISGAATFGPAARRLARALARGLRLDPRRRWPSMTSLIEALESERHRDRSRRRRAWRLGGVVSVAVLAAGSGWVVAEHGADDPVLACTGGALELEQVWGPEARERLMAAFDRGPAWAESLRGRTDEQLEDYARAWQRAHEDSCVGQRRGSLADIAYDRRTQCLARRRSELVAVVDVLTDLRSDRLAEVPDVLAVLGSIDQCSDDPRLALDAERVEPPSAALAPRVAEIDEQLARVDALQAAGLFAEAMHATEALADDPGLAHEPTAAKVEYALGSTLAPMGRAQEALVSQSKALWMAEAVGDAELAVRAARDRLSILAVLGRLDEAMRWVPHAQALARRNGDPLDSIHLELVLADLDATQGRISEARDRLVAAVAALYADDFEPTARARLMSTALGSLAYALMELGKHEDAVYYAEQALEQTEQIYGQHHPTYGLNCYRAGVVLLATRRPERAVQLLQRAVEIHEASVSPVHPNTLAAKQAYARALRAIGRLHEARELGARTLAEIVEHVGADGQHAQVAYLAQGITLMELGELEAARVHLEASLKLKRAMLKTPDEQLIPSLRYLADVELATGRLDRAQALYQEAEEIFDAGDQRHPLDRADLLSGRGGVALARGEHGAARELLEEALAVRERTVEHYPQGRATLMMRLAKVRWALAGENEAAREDARQTARRGLEVLGEVGAGGDRQREELEQWLASVAAQPRR